jgi:UDP:flavonoid glycosyltransferase YjiC (YdhE family)
LALSIAVGCGVVRALLCSTSGAGHLGPTLAFARALRASGTEVAFVVPATLADALAGWEVVVADDPPAAATAALWARVAEAPEEAARLVNGELFGELCTTAMLPAVARACTELEPAFLLHEPCAYAAPIAAARRGLPSAQVAISLAEVEDGSLAHAAPALESIEPGIVKRLRNAPYLTRFPAALDPSPFADTRRYRDDVVPERPGGDVAALPDWWPGDERPLVYATLGSAAAGRAGAEAAYRALAGTAMRLDARVLVTVGREIDPAALGPLPPHVHVERWVAQERVLPHAAAVVCHGGSGTLFGALAAGLPVVALPLFADQPVNARLLAAAGAGIAVTPPTALDTVESARVAADLGAAVDTVLRDASYARASRAIAAQIATAPGPGELLARWRS